MAKGTMISEDKKWQMESDARTLAEAKQIMGDPKRLKGAANAAKQLAEDKMTEAKAMTQVAKKAKQPEPKATSKTKKK